MSRRRAWQVAVVLVAALALAASANSIGNGFVYDDVSLIANAPRVHSWDGWWTEFARTYWPEGDGYRPLTMLAFRAQWALGGGSPVAFHAVNVALHVAGSLGVLWLAAAILSPWGAWTAAGLYAVHPVHAEAIANVVGQSELIVGLLVVLAVATHVRGRESATLTPVRWTVIGALYVAACLFKEHAIVLPALLVLAECLVVRDQAPLRARLLALRTPMLALTLVAVAYLGVRSAVVIGGLAGFRPFAVFDALDLTNGQRALTMVGVSAEWFRLLLWPAQLATQYSPPETPVAQAFSFSLIPGLLLLVAAAVVAVLAWRRIPAASFGIGWAAITLLPSSNFIVPAGFIIAERTLLLPSVGAMIAVGAVVVELVWRYGASATWGKLSVAALVLVLGLGVWRSVRRNRVWASDERLWQQGVIDTPESYLAHFRLGVHLFSTQRPAEGEAHYRRAIALFPHDPLVVYAFAEQLRVSGRCDAAMPLYAWLFEARPGAHRGHLGRAQCHVAARRYADARDDALAWIRNGGRVASAREVLAAVRAGRDSTERTAR